MDCHRVEHGHRRAAEIFARAHQDQPGFGSATGRHAQKPGIADVHRGQRRALHRQLRAVVVIEHFVERIDPAWPQRAMRVKPQRLERAKIDRVFVRGARAGHRDYRRGLIGRGVGQRYDHEPAARLHPRHQIAQKHAPRRAFVDAVDQRQKQVAMIGGQDGHGSGCHTPRRGSSHACARAVCECQAVLLIVVVMIAVMIVIVHIAMPVATIGVIVHAGRQAQAGSQQSHSQRRGHGCAFHGEILVRVAGDHDPQARTLTSGAKGRILRPGPPR